jgi:hypothetical protein
MAQCIILGYAELAQLRSPPEMLRGVGVWLGLNRSDARRRAGRRDPICQMSRRCVSVFAVLPVLGAMLRTVGQKRAYSTDALLCCLSFHHGFKKYHGYWIRKQ